MKTSPIIFALFFISCIGLSQDRLTNWSPKEDILVYISGKKENTEIYLINANGTGRRRVTNNKRIEKDPVFTPDGHTLIYKSSYNGIDQIYSVNIDGSEEKNLTNSNVRELSFSVSPNGEKIAFVSTRQIMGKLYLMNIDGSNQEYFYKTDKPVMYVNWVPNSDILIFHELVYGTASRAWGSIKDKKFETIFPDAETITVIEDWLDSDRAIINEEYKDYLGSSSATNYRSSIFINDFTSNEKTKIGKSISNLNSIQVSPIDNSLLLINTGIKVFINSPQIFTYRIGEKKAEKLVKGYKQASWSPSGEYIAMIKKDQYYIMKSDGSDIIKIE